MRVYLFLIIAVSLNLAFATTKGANAEQKISPYLASHADDLVQWQPWSQASLQQAQRENKLLLISSGYLACRYCYVMKNESFENREIAAFINQHFIPILIDSEMDPVLDAQLQRFMEALEQPQGWPLQVILTPQRNPLTGTVYQPPKTFLRFLQRVQTRWQESPEHMAEIAQNATEAIIRELSTKAFSINDDLKPRFVEALWQQALLVADDEHGGFGDGAKYPMSPQMLALIDLYALQSHNRLRQVLLHSLDAMVSGALYDAVNGGFFRYTTTQDWRNPHYEKMLDINAQLANLYLQAAQNLNRPVYLSIAKNTLDMLLRDFSLSSGGFANSLSAVDISGHDGGSYLWKKSTLQKHLPHDDYKLVIANWHPIEPIDDYEYLPVLGSLDKLDPQSASFLTWNDIFTRLRTLRAKAKPARDEKIVATSHGLVLKAFSNYAKHEPDALYTETATRLFNLIKNRLWQGNYLQHSNVGGEANLADYAYLAEGCFAFARLTGDARALELSADLARLAWQKFYVDGFWRQMQQLEQLMPYTVYPVTLQDTQLPSASATLIRVTLALGEKRVGEVFKLATQAQHIADANMAESPFFYATQILSLAQKHETAETN